MNISLFLRDLGYGATFSSNVIFATLELISIYPNKASSVTDEQVGKLLAMMVSTAQGLPSNPSIISITQGLLSDVELDQLQKLKTWNVELFFPLLMKMNPVLDWTNVLHYLDQPDLVFLDQTSLAIILKATKAVIKDMSLFPTLIFLNPWNNQKAQLSFLFHALTLTHEIFTMNQLLTNKVIQTDLPSRSSVASSVINSAASSPWNYLDLVQFLVSISDGPNKVKVREIFNLGVQQSPDLLLLALCQEANPDAPIVLELGAKLIVLLITGHPHSPVILPRVWQLSPRIFIAGLITLYREDPSSISRILDISQELKALSRILETNAFSFTIDLAALASRREYLNLEKWLTDHIKHHGETFYRACLDFLSDKVAVKPRADGSTTVPLSIEITRIFQTVLEVNVSGISVELKEYARKILQVCYQSAAGEVAQAEAYPDSSEALDYYQRLYAGEMSITQIIDVLKRFKISNIPGEQEIYKSMIQALFDDYKFIARYPERQLLITGVLFGSLIQNEVINAMPLGIALRYILDGLRQTYGSPLFKFSYNALLQFQNRLAEWPQYCSLLLQIDHLNQSCPDIVFFIKSLSGPKPAPPIPTVLPLESNDFFEESALNLDGILLESQFILEQPPENIQEKILFVINNLSDQTIDQKVVEISEILLPRYYRWFGNYLVVKRATIEPNYHSMYIGCVDSLQIPPLHSIILYETFAELKKMLASENILNSSKERTLLKNLGSWLGLITVAKNSPIKHRNLAFKSLLLQGYDTKRLLVVIPFVCKVLEQCHGSKVFRPPNPWLMAIMKLLSELYNFAELKLNLKFEIEVLCKNLKLDIKDITPSDLMRTRRNKAVVREKLGSNAAPQANVVGELSNSESHIATANMESFVTFNPNIVLFNSQPALKKVVQMAIDRSISDVIVSPVVERSVTIAVISTRDLVIKDFALEPSEEKLRSSAHHMAQCLAGSLASVSSREPLRASMIATLRALLNQAGFNEETVSEQMVFVIVSDNLDLACSFMERAASEKAVREIDESLALAYHNRRKHSDRSAQPFYDMAVFSASRYPSTLPEPLRLRATGLSEQQLSIYQSFENVPHALTNLLAEKAARERVETPGSFEDNNALIPTVEAADKFYEIMNEMDPIIRENPLQSFAALSSHQVIQTCIQKIVWLVSRSAKPEDSTSIFAQKILQILYRDPIDSALLVYVWLLTKLIETSPKVLNELREWFFYQEDERKCNVKICKAFLQADFFDILELDVQLSRMIECTNLTFIGTFTVNLIRSLVFEEPIICTSNTMLLSLQSLANLAAKDMPVAGYAALLDDLLNHSALSIVVRNHAKEGKETEALLRENLAIQFKEWVQIYSHPGTSDLIQRRFINQCLGQGLLKYDSVTPLFFRVCVEICERGYEKNSNSSEETGYEAVDAFARMIILLIQCHSDPTGVDHNHVKLNLTAKILSIIVLVLVHSHEKNQQLFNQKPYFRLFSSFLNNLKANRESIEPIYIQILSAISNTFHTLQPSFIPGFTYAWLQLIAHRNFMPSLLQSENQKFWPFYQRLLIDLFKFQAPALREPNLTNPSKALYDGTLRLLLVILHDFPEFLCDYHFSLIDILPENCIQMRNLIQSAFPRNMRLPDPFTTSLRVDLLPEIHQAPRILSDYTTVLVSGNLKQDIDTYIAQRTPTSFASDLKNRLGWSDKDGIVQYNSSLINSVVLYIAVQATAQHTSINDEQIAASSAKDIFQTLLSGNIDTRGRYLILSAMANQLRYSNSHTHFFSVLLLSLFEHAEKPVVQEQITRVLVERLIVHRPHPYGVLVTFIEMLKNPKYKFWDHSFIRAAPELERLFQSVAKSINNSIPPRTAEAQ